MNELQGLGGLGGTVVVAGLIEVIKPFIKDQRFWHLASIVLGIAWNAGVATVINQPLLPAAMLGIVVGLSASGLYSTVRSIKSE